MDETFHFSGKTHLLFIVGYIFNILSFHRRNYTCTNVKIWGRSFPQGGARHQLHSRFFQQIFKVRSDESNAVPRTRTLKPFQIRSKHDGPASSKSSQTTQFHQKKIDCTLEMLEYIGGNKGVCEI